jgi:hypothetical protein
MALLALLLLAAFSGLTTTLASADVPALPQDPSRPVALVDLMAGTPRLAHPLVAGELVDLTMEGLAPSAPFTITSGPLNTPLASGTADKDGSATVAGFMAPAPGEINLASGGHSWTLSVGVPSAAKLAVPDLPMPANVPPVVPDTNVHPNLEPSKSVLASQEVRYGHWRVVVTWYKIDNDNDPTYRYYITSSQWFGNGDTNCCPYHMYSDVYHAALGVRSSGNTFMGDYEPAFVNAQTGSYGYSVGKEGPSAQVSWTQTSPMNLRSTDTMGSDPTWDQDTYGATSTFVSSGHTYTGTLNYAAQGNVPGTLGAYMYFRMDHDSYACSVCLQEYHDDTGWLNRALTWT